MHTFKEWGARRVEDKAPTRLKYHEGRPTSWGFTCAHDSQGTVEEWFKTDFGDQNLSGAAQTKVKRLYKDYLTFIFEQLRVEFTTIVLNGKEWDAAAIHFLFSVPATWSPDVVDDFCQIAKAAGFGSQPGFMVKASLTEPHAVAAYTLSCEGFVEVSIPKHRNCTKESEFIDESIGQNGQTMLIIDAGGGTVVRAASYFGLVLRSLTRDQDLCFLLIEDAKKRKVSMTEVQPVQGKLLCQNSRSGQLTFLRD